MKIISPVGIVEQTTPSLVAEVDEGDELDSGDDFDVFDDDGEESVPSDEATFETDRR